MTLAADNIGVIVRIAMDAAKQYRIANVDADEWVSQAYVLAAEMWHRFDAGRGKPSTFIKRFVRPALVNCMFRSAGYYRGTEGGRAGARTVSRNPIRLECDVCEGGFASLPGLRWATLPTPCECKRAAGKRYRRSKKVTHGQSGAD